MAESGAVLPGALEAEAFFGRADEFQRLRRDARSLLRGRGRSRALAARPGWGKTELLRQWHGRLFREGEILPFYFAVPADGGGAGRQLAADFLAQLALQALAFRRREASLLLRPPPQRAVAEGLRSAWGAGGALLGEAALLLADGEPVETPLALAALVPHRLAAATGTRLLVLLDDAANLVETGRRVCWPEAAVSSALAPLLLTLDESAALTRLLGSDAPAKATLEALGPLGAGAAAQLARHLSRAAGLEIAEPAVAALVREAAGSPFYLAALVRALQEQPGAGAEEVARAAAAAVCDGELARYWSERLAGFLPGRGTRAAAVEILAYCVREEQGAMDPGRLPGLMLKPEREVEAALEGLERAGMIRLDCARIVVDSDPVFREALAALYRREFARATPLSVTAACAAEKVRGAPAAERRARQDVFRAELAALLGAWSGQQVPAVLFDAAEFQRRAAAAGEGGAPSLAGEEAQVSLPRVISVASGRLGAGASLPDFEVDALAWALRAEAGAPDADVAWVACRFPGGAGGAAQLTGFDRQIAALQAAGELPPARVIRWALLDQQLDAEGERAAASLRLATSLPAQLERLAALLGVSAPAPPPAARGERPALEMEMTIPRAADAELVAARALEQLAENLELEPEQTGRLKTALVEACINAFEHSGERDGRVRVWFGVVGGQLLIRVENRGRSLGALPAATSAGGTAQRRGWGLTLIRRLVDDVRLEPREDGVSLLLIKNLEGARRG